MKCKKHPKYKGMKYPSTDCPPCRRIYRANWRALMSEMYDTYRTTTKRPLEPRKPLKPAPKRDKKRQADHKMLSIEAMVEDFTARHGESYGLDPDLREQNQFEHNMNLARQAKIQALLDQFEQTRPLQEEAPEEPLFLPEVHNYCTITGLPWGPSFVCPWSHDSHHRRLPRAWIARRNMMDCLGQEEIWQEEI